MSIKWYYLNLHTPTLSDTEHLFFTFFKHKKDNYNFGKEGLSLKRMASTDMRPLKLKKKKLLAQITAEELIILQLRQHKVLD